jgi:hypothetical protein
MKSGITTRQAAAYWRAFGAACSTQAIPADQRDAYRHRVMDEACGKASIKALNRTTDYDAVMLRWCLDAEDYAAAAHYSVGQEGRLIALVEAAARQIMQCQGGDDAAATAYVAGIIEQAGYSVVREGNTHLLDLSSSQLSSLFRMLDTHRRRLIERSGTRPGRFSPAAVYRRDDAGAITITSDLATPEGVFRIRLRA